MCEADTADCAAPGRQRFPRFKSLQVPTNLRHTPSERKREREGKRERESKSERGGEREREYNVPRLKDANLMQPTYTLPYGNARLKSREREEEKESKKQLGIKTKRE